MCEQFRGFHATGTSGFCFDTMTIVPIWEVESPGWLPEAYRIEMRYETIAVRLWLEPAVKLII
jgi:hypothetical protein